MCGLRDVGLILKKSEISKTWCQTLQGSEKK